MSTEYICVELWGKRKGVKNPNTLPLAGTGFFMILLDLDRPV